MVQVSLTVTILVQCNYMTRTEIDCSLGTLTEHAMFSSSAVAPYLGKSLIMVGSSFGSSYGKIVFLDARAQLCSHVTNPVHLSLSWLSRHQCDNKCVHIQLEILTEALTFKLIHPMQRWNVLFSNSLVIHKEIIKEITTVTVVWIPDLN